MSGVNKHTKFYTFLETFFPLQVIAMGAIIMLTLLNYFWDWSLEVFVCLSVYLCGSEILPNVNCQWL